MMRLSENEPQILAIRPTGWNSVAEFAVELQTRYINGQVEHRTVARCLATDALKISTGIEDQHLSQWMLEQVPAITLPQWPAAPLAVPITVEVAQMQLVQSARSRQQIAQTGLPMLVNRTHRLFPDPIAAGEPFSLDLSLQFKGLAAAKLAKQQLIYRVQCQARHLTSGSVIALGGLVANVPISAHSAYAAVLSEMTLQQPGAYRLQVLVTVQNAPAVPAQFKVPLLQVI